MAVYGEKRDHTRIELFVGGAYYCTTTWAKTNSEAKQKLAENLKIDIADISARKCHN